MKINASTQKSPYLRAHRGMTLLEIVIVIGIIGLIMAAGIGTFGGVLGGANQKATEIKIQSLKTVLESYKLIGGSYPNQSQGLQACSVSCRAVARQRVEKVAHAGQPDH